MKQNVTAKRSKNGLAWAGTNGHQVQLSLYARGIKPRS